MFYSRAALNAILSSVDDPHAKPVLSLISEESLVRHRVREIINSFENNPRLLWSGF